MIDNSECNIFNPVRVYPTAMILHFPRILVLFFCTVANMGVAQTAAEYEATYAARIKQEVINGVYIPSNLEDAFAELQRLSDPNGMIQFKSSPEDSIRRKLHFGLGRWILINWGLEEGSRYSHYLKGLGVSVPDDMVRLTIVGWHRHLNNRPLKLEEELKAIEERMEKEQLEREKNKQVVKRDTVPHKE